MASNNDQIVNRNVWHFEFENGILCRNQAGKPDTYDVSPEKDILKTRLN